MIPHPLQSIMKKDGRAHDRKTKETIRLMAVERIREGEEVATVMASYGLCRTTGYKWLAKASGRGRGLRALEARKACAPRQTRPCQTGPPPLGGQSTESLGMKNLAGF